MNFQRFTVLSTLFLNITMIAHGQTTATVEMPGTAVATPPANTKPLSSFLAEVPKPEGPDTDSPYATVPPELDQAVRYLSMENYTSAGIALMSEYEKHTSGFDRARVAMWLGINYGMKAIDYPTEGWQAGTSATTFLKEAVHIDPKVFEAPDVARMMAEMVAHGWATEDPATALTRAEQRAEETRRTLDFYFAGVISRRLAARAWGYSDTTEQDKKTLSLFAKSLARDPGRYETWSAYLPALLPAGMHDLATTEAKAMYNHFQNLRTPLMGDQGPARLLMSTSSFRTMPQDDELLAAVEKKWPHAPMPPFELGMRAIETSPPLALKLFPELIKRFETGDVKPMPREAGYYPSSLYKYAFLLQSVDQQDESIKYYKKVREISPTYAEVNLNLGILYAMKAEKLTTGTEKINLLEESLKYTSAQEKLDYKGKATLKASEMRQRLRSILYRLKKETGLKR